jgi:uncharacterized protein (DUF608 family)
MVGPANAQEIHYWGHYPIADLEYDTTSEVSVGLRAWTPFIPGDAPTSNLDRSQIFVKREKRT